MDRIDGGILVTGAAGFIGYHLCRRLLAAGVAVTGLDNLNDYYDPALKQARLDQLREFPTFSFRRLDLADQNETLRERLGVSDREAVALQCH